MYRKNSWESLEDYVQRLHIRRHELQKIGMDAMTREQLVELINTSNQIEWLSGGDGRYET